MNIFFTRAEHFQQLFFFDFKSSKDLKTSFVVPTFCKKSERTLTDNKL